MVIRGRAFGGHAASRSATPRSVWGRRHSDATPVLPFGALGPCKRSGLCRCRVYFSYTMTDVEVDYIIAAVCDIARHAWKLLPQYELDPSGRALRPPPPLLAPPRHSPLLARPPSCNFLLPAG